MIKKNRCNTTVTRRMWLKCNPHADTVTHVHTTVTRGGKTITRMVIKYSVVIQQLPLVIAP